MKATDKTGQLLKDYRKMGSSPFNPKMIEGLNDTAMKRAKKNCRKVIRGV